MGWKLASLGFVLAADCWPSEALVVVARVTWVAYCLFCSAIQSPLASAIGLCGATQFFYLKYGARIARGYDQETVFLRYGFQIVVIYQLEPPFEDLISNRSVNARFMGCCLSNLGFGLFGLANIFSQSFCASLLACRERTMLELESSDSKLVKNVFVSSSVNHSGSIRKAKLLVLQQLNILTNG
ncbi:hypothetical protein V6N11_044875 [Hibiscus sabdariffa]|uniref:Uncharacterized protein n=1 Tax=Hibiscus sabdariffa TaxID=183260 RepID=A0ABR2PUN7_9ROSI